MTIDRENSTSTIGVIDHNDFRLAKLPVYAATAHAYRIIASAYVLAAELAESADPDHVASFRDAEIGAKQYAEHCAHVVDFAKRGAAEEHIAAYDRIYGNHHQTCASIWISEV